MNPSIKEKLDQLVERQEEINALLTDPEIIGQQNRFRELSIELADISPVVEEYDRYRGISGEIDDTESMMEEDDAEIRDMARTELPLLKDKLELSTQALRKLLIPRDRNDEKNLFLEIRAGTGGDEAALFSGDLFRMYQLYAENRGWRMEVMSSNAGEVGGFREVITRIVGRGAWSRLKFESGAHRVQRVPETEAQGRIHTSACTVAVMPEADEMEEIEINSNELRIDTYRSSGAGGQHVNKTDSAIRITHLPSGIVVECQDERSQHKNRARAMSILRARLLEAEESRRRAEEAQTRRDLVGSGDRSERIRTYNFPQGRVTDHRINLTLYRLEDVLAGALDLVIDPLVSEHQADQLAALGAE